MCRGLFPEVVDNSARENNINQTFLRPFSSWAGNYSLKRSGDGGCRTRNRFCCVHQAINSLGDVVSRSKATKWNLNSHNTQFQFQRVFCMETTLTNFFSKGFGQVLAQFHVRNVYLEYHALNSLGKDFLVPEALNIHINRRIFKKFRAKRTLLADTST